jgi:hypothetical protein
MNQFAFNPNLSFAYARPEPEDLTPRDRQEILEREIRREKATRGWATRNRFPIYCLK